MKRIVTLFLLLLFLLNVLGFYGVFLGLKFSNSLRATRAMDEDRYPAEATVTFKVPLTVPYYTDPNAGFQRVDGEFEHDGKVFRMMKQKLHNDTLYVVCVADQKSSDIAKALADYVKTFSDKPVNAKQPGVKSLSFFKDYIKMTVTVESGQTGWSRTLTFFHYREIYRSGPANTVYSPPKITA